MNWLGLLGLDQWVARWRERLNEGAMAAEDRLALAQLEWSDQKSRLQRMAVLGIALIGLTVMVLIMLSMAVVIHFWDSPHRVLVGWLVAAVWLVAWAGSLVVLLQTVKQAGNAFALTRRELSKDWKEIKEYL